MLRLATRLLVLALALPAGAGLAGCKRKAETTDLEKKAPPPDRLAPDELAEGAVKVHGLRLPRRARVLKTVGELTFVRSDLTPAQLATYVRARVEGGRETAESATETRWDAITLKGGGGPRLDITVRGLHDADDPTEMVLHPLPKSNVPATASEEERWRAVGVTPNGKLIDSQKRE